MRLHAKLWGDNLFRVFPIWLVYCTFKHTERIKYTLRTGTASRSFWKARAVGILLLSPRPYRCSPADSCVPSLSCKTHNFIYFPAISTVEAGPQVQQDACRTQGQAHCSCTICRDEHLQPPCASLTTWYNFTPPTQSSLPTSNHKNYGQWKQTELGKDAGILTSVYLLSYHSLKLLSNSI